MKFRLAMAVAKSAQVVIKLMHKRGTSFAGYLALKICPDFLTYVKKYFTKGVINITGTNGKTTTTALIGHILSGCKSVISNVEGANMLTGIVNTLALKINPKRTYDYAVLETDEAYLTKIYDKLKGDYLVVTNLFADQLDRYGSVDFTKNTIMEAILKNPDLKVILNANDSVVSSLSENAVFYGFTEIDGKVCECHKTPDYSAVARIFDDKFEVDVKHNDVTDTFTVKMTGTYNAYNVLASIALAFEAGYSQRQIQASLRVFKAVFGRCEVRELYGRKALIQLIKNSAGANEVFKTLDLNSNIIIGVNNTVSDGKDVSWFWDSDFEKLTNATKPITVSGMRAYDLAVRLKYAGISTDKIIIEPDIKKAIKKVANSINSDEKITILPSYTVMWSII